MSEKKKYHPGNEMKALEEHIKKFDPNTSEPSSSEIS